MVRLPTESELEGALDVIGIALLVGLLWVLFLAPWAMLRGEARKIDYPAGLVGAGFWMLSINVLVKTI